MPLIVRDEIVSLSALRLRVRLMLDDGQIGEAIQLISNACMDDRDAVAALPLQRALDRGLAMEANFKCQIPWAIALDLGLSNIGKKYRRYRSYAVEDIWESYGLNRPSDIGPFVTADNRSLMIHYLCNLCISDVLSDTAAFQNIPELEEERIKVLQLLTEIDAGNADAYLAEIRTINRWLVIYNGFRRFDGSRLYVDRDGLIADLHTKLGREFNRMTALRREQLASGNLTEIVLHDIRPYKDDDLAGERVILTYALDNPLKILDNLLQNVAREFKRNNYYGLDVYLSTRIRHGTLKGYLRNPLEENHLICQKSHGQYLHQPYWRDRARDLNALDDCFQEALKAFSADIDDSIQSLNETALRVKTVDKDGWIDVEFNESDVQRFAILLDDIESDTDFFALAIAHMVKKLEVLLPSIRQRLEAGPRVEWNTRIGRLRSEVGLISNPELAAEFDASLTKAQLGIGRAFQVVSGWFTMSTGHTNPDYEIDLAIDIAAKSLESCFGHQALTYHRDGTESPLFEGRSLAAMVDIFFLLFENVYRHARDESIDCSPAVIVSVIHDDPVFCFSVRNLIPASKNITDVELAVLTARAGLALSQRDHDPIVNEGGSGFFKLQKILRADLKLLNCDFDFCVSDRGFEVNVMFDTTGITI